MDFQSFLDLAKRYADLGGAVQDQLLALDEGTMDPEDCNPNALRLIADFLQYAEFNGLMGTDLILDAIKDYNK